MVFRRIAWGWRLGSAAGIYYHISPQNAKPTPHKVDFFRAVAASFALTSGISYRPQARWLRPGHNENSGLLDIIAGGGYSEIFGRNVGRFGNICKGRKLHKLVDYKIMSVINKMTIKEQIYVELKHRILLRKYQPGERLNIDSLARELKVSNSPIREALIMLEKDELVYTMPNSGPRVIDLDEERTTEINQAIFVLLTGGYNLCLRMGRQKQLVEVLESRLRAQEALLDCDDPIKTMTAAIAFDRSFLDACGNKRLVDTYTRLADIFFLSVIQRNRNAREIEENINDHRSILKAARAFDEEAMRNLVAGHYRQPQIVVPPES